MTNQTEAISFEFIEKCFEDINSTSETIKKMQKNIIESSQKFMQELHDINENFKNH